MFSLRDSSNSSSSGTDEDSFGWWIGVELHSQEANESSTRSASSAAQEEQPVSVSSESLCTTGLEDDYALARDLAKRSQSTEAEHIELCSFGDDDDDDDDDDNDDDDASNGEKDLLEDDNDRRRAARCYTPERLISSEDYRILTPLPRLYPTLAELLTAQRNAHQQRLQLQRSLSNSVGGRLSAKTIDERNIGAAHLAALLQKQRPSASSWRTSCEHCYCVRYGDGEVLLQSDPGLRDHEEEEEEEEEGSIRLEVRDSSQLQSCSDYGSCCEESSRHEDDCCTRKASSRERELADDISEAASLDSTAANRADDWSCSTEDRERLSVTLPRQLSDELGYVSFEYTLAAREHQKERTSDLNEVQVSILTDLDCNPTQAELLLTDDRFQNVAQSGHDCLTRLALAIEPDGRLLPVKSLNQEAEFEQLRNRVERLQDSNKELYEEISILTREFTKDEWKVNHLSEDINKLRNEVYELRYLDDLLKLLKGELERISNRSWPFAIGHIKHGTEEINLVV